MDFTKEGLDRQEANFDNATALSMGLLMFIYEQSILISIAIGIGMIFALKWIREND